MELAAAQSSRDEELAGARRHAMEAEAEMREALAESERMGAQCVVLKDEIRSLRRTAERERMGADVTEMEYLKTVIVKLLETGEFEALLPVVATLLKLDPEEVSRVRGAYEAAAKASVPLPGAALAVDSLLGNTKSWLGVSGSWFGGGGAAGAGES